MNLVRHATLLFCADVVEPNNRCGEGKKMKYIVICLMGLLLLNGCAIIKAASQPRSRPPEDIIPGRTQVSVDAVYGHPVAVGMSADGKEYIEQIQFVDGISLRGKIVRVVLHTMLDCCTYFLWELVGFPIEVINSDHPEYIYYVVYDDNDNVIRAIPQDSEEGLRLATLPWSASNQECYEGDSRSRVKRLKLEERIAAAEVIAETLNKSVVQQSKEKNEYVKQTSSTNSVSRLELKETTKKEMSTLEVMLKEGLITQEEYERIKK
jgi:hypothetical protein